MSTYRYTALNDAGTLVRGEIEARDEAGAVKALRLQGLRPTALKAGSGGVMDLLHTEIRIGGGFGKSDLVLFLEELALLIGKGVSLKQALNISADMRPTASSKAIVSRLEAALTEGRSLADAMETQARHFPAFLRAIVRAGEDSGALEQMLASTADHMRRALQERQKLISALTYPAILLLATIGSIILLMTVVVPQFEPIFRASGAELPAATKMLMSVAGAVQAYGSVLAACLIVLLSVFLLTLRDRAAKVRLARVKARLPWIGALSRDMESARFAHALSVTLGNGLDLLRALQVCTDAARDPAFRTAMTDIQDAVRKGTRLGTAFEQKALGSQVLRKMMLLGEQSGQMPEMLAKAADLLDKKVQARIAFGLSLLVPVVTLVMGVVVGGTMYAIFSAVFSVNTLM